MDEYGTLGLEDCEKIAYEIEHGNVVFPFSIDKQTCHIIVITKYFLKMGVMPFGGNPTGRYYVGIYGKGCSHMAINGRESIGYIAEKLNVDEKSAEDIQRLFEGLSEYLK